MKPTPKQPNGASEQVNYHEAVMLLADTMLSHLESSCKAAHEIKQARDRAKLIASAPPVAAPTPFKLCHKCNREFEITGGNDNSGFTSNMQNCPHCGVRNDTWLHIPLNPERHRQNSNNFDHTKPLPGVPVAPTQKAVEAAREEHKPNVVIQPTHEELMARGAICPNEKPQEGTPTPEGIAVARLFHDTYERLAPSFGYETRKDTKQFDAESPNGKLMIAVCSEVTTQLRSRLAAAEQKVGELEKDDRYVRISLQLGDRPIPEAVDAFMAVFRQRTDDMFAYLKRSQAAEQELKESLAAGKDYFTMLHRICKQGFDLNDTISNEPFDEYILRQIGLIRSARHAAIKERDILREQLERRK